MSAFDEPDRDEAIVACYAAVWRLRNLLSQRISEPDASAFAELERADEILDTYLDQYNPASGRLQTRQCVDRLIEGVS